MEENKIKRWGKAIKHAREMLEMYKKIPLESGWFGVATIGESISLYEKGDRSEALLDRLEKIK